MWPSNALTERLNLKWPIIQAPMGSASTPALAAAVTNAGGLGGLGKWGRTAEQAARRIAGFRQQSVVASMSIIRFGLARVAHRISPRQCSGDFSHITMLTGSGRYQNRKV